MGETEILDGKRILIVDDEPDILETLEELLDMCNIDSAPDFETGSRFLEKNAYDLAILDIMGVNGYKLLEIARKKEIPVLMLTAHALSPDNLVKSLKSGAQSYVPKDKISDIAEFAAEIISSAQKGDEKGAGWFLKLKPFFDRKFGSGWTEKDRDFWDDFDKKFIASKDELNKTL